jgi:L-alanine-DL-glutamate epimerase-like enolase superfamily enzyme
LELRIRSVHFAVSRCRTRLPFRFGIATLTEAPLAIAHLQAQRIDAESSGQIVSGYAGDLLVPKWFEKNPARSAADDVSALMESMRRAAAAVEGSSGSPFAIWLRSYRECVEGGRRTGIALVDGFGVALLERALIDAACRAGGLSFFEALQQERLGFDAGALHPELAGIGSGGLVGRAPLERVVVRHTVGLLDPLRSAEVPPDLQRDDGHPVALEEDVRRYGLRCFKLKLGGEPEADRQRLLEIVRVLEEQQALPARFTLDGNEQYPDLEKLARLLGALEVDAAGRRLLEGLLYLEQPLPRDVSLEPGVADGLRALDRFAPLILDEADADLAAFPRALTLGYRGVSVKNCKGVFRALANRAICQARADGSFQASEDLTNLPILPLQQDLATVAALGLPHTERNGHHYFRGLDHLPESEAEAALAAHPDLYERYEDRIGLRITAGELALGSLQGPGYGYATAIDATGRVSLDAYQRGAQS